MVNFYIKLKHIIRGDNILLNITEDIYITLLVIIRIYNASGYKVYLKYKSTTDDLPPLQQLSVIESDNSEQHESYLTLDDEALNIGDSMKNNRQKIKSDSIDNLFKLKKIATDNNLIILLELKKCKHTPCRKDQILELYSPPSPEGGGRKSRRRRHAKRTASRRRKSRRQLRN
jgi:hypothetical protein